MVTMLTKFLLIILALLQLVTPLVHAHTSGEPSESGVHLPGYEHLSVNIDSAEFHAISHSYTIESSIISVAAGIKAKKILSDYSLAYLPAENFSYKSVAQKFSVPSVLQRPTVYSVAEYTLLPSRAPPLQTI